jgi:hypothetical protein
VDVRGFAGGAGGTWLIDPEAIREDCNVEGESCVTFEQVRLALSNGDIPQTGTPPAAIGGVNFGDGVLTIRSPGSALAVVVKSSGESLELTSRNLLLQGDSGLNLSGGKLSFVDGAGSASIVTLKTIDTGADVLIDGAIEAPTGFALNVDAKDAIGGLGTLQASTLSLLARAGNITVTTSGATTLAATATGAGSDVTVSHTGALTLASSAAADQFQVTSSGAIKADDYAVTTISAPTIVLTATSGTIGEAALGQTAAKLIKIRNPTVANKVTLTANASGGVYLSSASPVEFSGESGASGASSWFMLTSSGAIATASGGVIAASNIDLEADAGNITVTTSGATMLTATAATRTVTVSHSGGILSHGAITAGTVDLTNTSANAAHGIATASGGVIAASNIDLEAAGNITVTTSGATTLAATATGAGSDVTVSHTGALTLASSAAADQFQVTSSGAIKADDYAVTTISAPTIVLTATSGTIGEAALGQTAAKLIKIRNPTVANKVTLTANASGGVYLSSASPVEFSGESGASGASSWFMLTSSGAIATASGGVIAASNIDLEADAGNITVTTSGATMLTATAATRTVTVSHSGGILSHGAITAGTVDLTNTSANAAHGIATASGGVIAASNIDLEAAGNITVTTSGATTLAATATGAGSDVTVSHTGALTLASSAAADQFQVTSSGAIKADDYAVTTISAPTIVLTATSGTIGEAALGQTAAKLIEIRNPTVANKVTLTANASGGVYLSSASPVEFSGSSGASGASSWFVVSSTRELTIKSGGSDPTISAPNVALIGASLPSDPLVKGIAERSRPDESGYGNATKLDNLYLEMMVGDFASGTRLGLGNEARVEHLTLVSRSGSVGSASSAIDLSTILTTRTGDQPGIFSARANSVHIKTTNEDDHRNNPSDDRTADIALADFTAGRAVGYLSPDVANHANTVYRVISAGTITGTETITGTGTITGTIGIGQGMSNQRSVILSALGAIGTLAAPLTIKAFAESTEPTTLTARSSDGDVFVKHQNAGAGGGVTIADHGSGGDGSDDLAFVSGSGKSGGGTFAVRADGALVLLGSVKADNIQLIGGTLSLNTERLANQADTRSLTSLYLEQTQASQNFTGSLESVLGAQYTVGHLGLATSGDISGASPGFGFGLPAGIAGSTLTFTGHAANVDVVANSGHVKIADFSGIIAPRGRVANEATATPTGLYALRANAGSILHGGGAITARNILLSATGDIGAAGARIETKSLGADPTLLTASAGRDEVVDLVTPSNNLPALPGNVHIDHLTGSVKIANRTYDGTDYTNTARITVSAADQLYALRANAGSILHGGGAITARNILLSATGDIGAAGARIETKSLGADPTLLTASAGRDEVVDLVTPSNNLPALPGNVHIDHLTGSVKIANRTYDGTDYTNTARITVSAADQLYALRALDAAPGSILNGGGAITARNILLSATGDIGAAGARIETKSLGADPTLLTASAGRDEVVDLVTPSNNLPALPGNVHIDHLTGSVKIANRTYDGTDYTNTARITVSAADQLYALRALDAAPGSILNGGGAITARNILLSATGDIGAAGARIETKSLGADPTLLTASAGRDEVVDLVTPSNNLPALPGNVHIDHLTGSVKIANRTYDGTDYTNTARITVSAADQLYALRALDAAPGSILNGGGAITARNILLSATGDIGAAGARIETKSLGADPTLLTASAGRDEVVDLVTPSNNLPALPGNVHIDHLTGSVKIANRTYDGTDYTNSGRQVFGNGGLYALEASDETQGAPGSIRDGGGAITGARIDLDAKGGIGTPSYLFDTNPQRAIAAADAAFLTDLNLFGTASFDIPGGQTNVLAPKYQLPSSNATAPTVGARLANFARNFLATNASLSLKVHAGLGSVYIHEKSTGNTQANGLQIDAASTSGSLMLASPNRFLNISDAGLNALKGRIVLDAAGAVSVNGAEIVANWFGQGPSVAGLSLIGDPNGGGTFGTTKESTLVLGGLDSPGQPALVYYFPGNNGATVYTSGQPSANVVSPASSAVSGSAVVRSFLFNGLALRISAQVETSSAVLAAILAESANQQRVASAPTENVFRSVVRGMVLKAGPGDPAVGSSQGLAQPAGCDVGVSAGGTIACQ